MAFVNALGTQKVLEHAVELRYCRMAAEWGCVAVKIFMRDWPDRLIILPNGRSYFCELKRPGEKPRRKQKRIHAMLREMGHVVHVYDGTDWPAALKFLQTELMRDV